jgi:hypothetical protein
MSSLDMKIIQPLYFCSIRFAYEHISASSYQVSWLTIYRTFVLQQTILIRTRECQVQTIQKIHCYFSSFLITWGVPREGKYFPEENIFLFAKQYNTRILIRTLIFHEEKSYFINHYDLMAKESVCQFVSLSICMSARLCLCLSPRQFVCLPVCISALL